MRMDAKCIKDENQVKHYMRMDAKYIHSNS